MTGLEIAGGIVALLAVVVPLILKGLQNRKANRNEIGKAESAELGAGMDRVDAATRVQPDDGKRD